jgi:hypothetical protein
MPALRSDVLRLALALACVAAGAGCDSGGGPARGFGSRQLVQLRDPTFTFVGAFGRYALYALGDFAVEAPRNFAVDVESGEIIPYTTYTELPVWSTTTPPGRYACVYGSTAVPDGGAAPAGITLVVTDRTTGVETTIEDIYAYTPGCPKEGDTTVTFWRKDEAGVLTLWSGPYDAIAQVALEPSLTIVGLITFGNVRSEVFASLPGAPDAVGIYRIDLDTFAVSEQIPAKLDGAAWISGAPDTGTLESSSVGATTSLRFRSGDLLVYARIMSDGRIVVFSGPYPSGPRELALFEYRTALSVEVVTQRPADGVYGGDRIVLPVFRLSDLHLDTDELLVWDRPQQRVVRCALPRGTPLQVVASRTAHSEHILLEPRQFDSSVADPGGDLGPAVLLSPGAASEGDGSGACVVLAERDVSAARLSPDGTAMFWLVTPPDRWEADLWTAASDGSGRRLVGSGDIATGEEGPAFIGPSQLALRLEGDLDWFDVHDDPVHMRYIAERVFGNAIYLGRWLILGYGYSGQDMTGRLGVVDRDATAGPRLISPEVVDYVSPEYPSWWDTWTTPGGEPVPIHVVYLVRGRNPSPQDGVWMATVNPSDVP